MPSRCVHAAYGRYNSPGQIGQTRSRYHISILALYVKALLSRSDASPIKGWASACFMNKSYTVSIYCAMGEASFPSADAWASPKRRKNKMSPFIAIYMMCLIGHMNTVSDTGTTTWPATTVHIVCKGVGCGGACAKHCRVSWL